MTEAVDGVHLPLIHLQLDYLRHRRGIFDCWQQPAYRFFETDSATKVKRIKASQPPIHQPKPLRRPDRATR